jgi:hypothetical protein
MHRLRMHNTIDTSNAVQQRSKNAYFNVDIQQFDPSAGIPAQMPQNTCPMQISKRQAQQCCQKVLNGPNPRSVPRVKRQLFPPIYFGNAFQ